MNNPEPEPVVRIVYERGELEINIIALRASADLYGRLAKIALVEGRTKESQTYSRLCELITEQAVKKDAMWSAVYGGSVPEVQPKGNDNEKD